MNSPAKNLTALLILLLSYSALADNWFKNSDSVTDLARLAPAESVFFVSLDISQTFSNEELIARVKKTVEQAGGPRAVRQLEQEIGPVDEFAKIFGSRAMIALTPPSQGEPTVVFALEVTDHQAAVKALKAIHFIPGREVDKTVKIKGATFSWIGKGGYGPFEDYLLISNSPEALKKTLEEGQNLHSQKAFHDHVARVRVDQGVLMYGEVPHEFTKDFQELQALTHVLAGLGIYHHEFITQVYALLNTDNEIAKALLSEGGTLKGEAARFIPDSWGFMASFHLGYVHRFLSHIEQNNPDLARHFVRDLEQMEKAIGVTMEELLAVLDGEVSISSNGMRLLPVLFFGYGSSSSMDYKLTVTMPVRDVHAAHFLMKRAWKRLGLKTDKRMDDIIVVNGVELAYIVERQSKQLIMSYGPSSVKTLRHCLTLRESYSLASRKNLSSHYPVKNGIASGYLDLRPVVEQLEQVPQLGSIETILGANAALDGVLNLTVQPDGLKLAGTGGIPMLLGVGVGAGFFLVDEWSGGSEAVQVKEATPSDR